MKYMLCILLIVVTFFQLSTAQNSTMESDTLVVLDDKIEYKIDEFLTIHVEKNTLGDDLFIRFSFKNKSKNIIAILEDFSYEEINENSWSVGFLPSYDLDELVKVKKLHRNDKYSLNLNVPKSNILQASFTFSFVRIKSKAKCMFFLNKAEVKKSSYLENSDEIFNDLELIRINNFPINENSIKVIINHYIPSI